MASVRGAVGLFDAALWDLAAKAADEPLWSLLAKRHGNANANAKIAIYASGGHYRRRERHRWAA